MSETALMFQGIPLFASEAIGVLDRLTIERRGGGMILMQEAGGAVAQWLLGRTPRPQVVAVLAGPGNNGGDGYVAARELRANNIDATVLAYRDPDALEGDAAKAYADWADDGGQTRILPEDDADLRSCLHQELDRADWLVDALFGTGLHSELRPRARRVVEMVAAIAGDDAVGIVAVDIPSGINADDGRVLGVALPAAATVTMGAEKPGLWIWPGRGFAGEVTLVDLGYDPVAIAEQEVAGVKLHPDYLRWPYRPDDGHKGRFGAVGAFAGSAAMPGAAALVARGALRAGAGKVLVASAPGGDARLDPEVIGRPLPPISETSAPEVVQVLDDADVVVIGPGLGRSDHVRNLVLDLVSTAPWPVVVDADGLWALEGRLDQLRDRRAVLTPHPGEAGILLGSDARTVQKDRLLAARELASRSGAVVVLKGAGTIIAVGDGWAVDPHALPGLAVPGSGDVLAGIVGSLIAQGLPLSAAAATAVWVHSAAGVRLPQIGNLAREVADAVQHVIADRRRG